MSECSITLHVDEPQPITLDYIEAKIKPEVVGHATPTEQAQTVTPSPGTTFSAVDIDAIPPEYIVPTGTVNITENGETDVTEYASALVAVPQPSGKITITENATGLNIEQYAEADINVQQGVFPEGTLEITENGTDIDVTEYAAVDVNVNPSGWVFDEFDANNCPTRARFFATENNSVVPKNFMSGYSHLAVQAIAHITTIELSEGTTNVGTSAFERREITRFVMPSTVIVARGDYIFRNCANLEEFDFMGDCELRYFDFMGTALKRLTAHKNVVRIVGTRIFPATTGLIDFSHCTSVPTLSTVDAFQDVISCRMLVPAALLDEWQNATNWNALTNVTFDGV